MQERITMSYFIKLSADAHSWSAAESVAPPSSGASWVTGRLGALPLRLRPALK